MITPAAILTIVSFVFAALFGMVGLHHQYRSPRTNAVTPWGKISLAGIVLSAALGVLSTIINDRSEIIEKQGAAEEIAYLKSLASESARNSNQIVTNLDRGSLVFSLDIPCGNNFASVCQELLSEFRPFRRYASGGSMSFILSNGAYARLPRVADYDIYVRVANDPMPDCTACNPGGIMTIHAATHPRAWRIIVGASVDRQGNVHPRNIHIYATTTNFRVNSYGTELPSLESLRGRHLSVIFMNNYYGRYVSGIILGTQNGQQVGLGHNRMRIRRQRLGWVAESRFPRDRDPRLFQDEIFYESGSF